MLISEFSTACCVGLFYTYPILVQGASEQCPPLDHLLNQPFTPNIAESIKRALDTSPNQTESYLRIAIKMDDSEAAEYIFQHAKQSSMLGELIESIYKKNSPVVSDDQVFESGDSRFAKLILKESISTIDLGCLLGLEELIKLLVEWKSRYRDGIAEAIRGNETDVMNLIVEKSLGINVKNKHGENLLHTACRLNKPKLVKLLIARHNIHRTKTVICMSLDQEIYDKAFSNTILDVNSQTNYGEIPLHYACKHGSPELVALLLGIPEININIQDKCGYTPIMGALDWERYDIVNVLLARPDLNSDAEDNNGNTLLHIACEKGQLEIVKQLVDKYKVKVNIKDKWRRTPIMSASFFGEWKVVNVLLARKDLKVDAKDEYGNTSLHIACQQGELETVRQLLANSKVDVSIENNNGYTPMEIAEHNGFSDILGLFENRKS